MKDKKETICEGCTLTEDELKKIKNAMIESLAIDRQQLLVNFPFMGNLLLRMELIPVRDRRVMTACTDGNKIYFSINFYSKLSVQERIFVLAHELFHCVLLHLTRCQTRIPDLFNIATDMEVNYCLSQQGSEMTPPADLCFPPKSMQGKSAEVIYEWLIRKMKQQKKNGQQMQIPNGSYGKQKSNGNNKQQSDDESYDDGNGWGSSKQRDPKQASGQGKNGKNTGNLEGQFDNHKFDSELDSQNKQNGDGKSDNGNGEDGEPTDQYGKIGYDPDYNPKIAPDFADRMREAVIAEAQRCQRTQGKLPAGLEGILDRLPKPEISWQELLSQFVCSYCGQGKKTWERPNRRHIYNEIYLQSRRTEKVKVGVIVDTSGSCWGDQNKFFSELNNLMKTFGGYELYVVQCDADVQRIDKYDEENPFPIDDPKAIELSGCGGSDFKPAFKALREEGIENDVDVIICLTDGYIDFPTYPPSKPCLIILTKDGNKNCCEWGKKIVFKNDSIED